MLSYETDGRGPSLLMIHGFGISFNIWNALRTLLRDHFTLIMVEMPGIGRSPAPSDGYSYLDAAAQDMEELRRKLGIESWHVLSYSSGTRAAEHYVSLHAQHVRSAAFLSPAETSRGSAASLRAAIRIDRRFPRLGDWVLSGRRLKFLVRLLGFNLKPNMQVQAWSEEIGGQPVEILKETLRTIPGGGAGKFSLPSGMPCLFIWGSKDLITASPRRESGSHRLIRANHSAPQTAAREVAELLIPFFSGVSG